MWVIRRGMYILTPIMVVSTTGQVIITNPGMVLIIIPGRLPTVTA